MSARLWRWAAGPWLAATLASGAACQTADPEWGLKLTGLAGTPIAGGSAHSSRWTVEPSLKFERGAWAARADVRLRQLDQAGDHEDRVDLREFSVARRGDESTLTVGAQQVNWGRMDLLRVTDAVNPVDQQDLFYEDLPEAKLALGMLNWEWQRDSTSVQLLVAPQVAVDRLPSAAAGLPIQARRPAASARTATYAARYGFEYGGWNTDLVAIRGWQPAPSLVPVRVAGGVHLEPVLYRQDSAGFSADRPFGGVVLRVEGQVAKARPYDAAPYPDHAVRHLETLGIGADLHPGSWLLATQVIVQRQSGEGPATTAYLSAIVQRKWLQDRLALRATHLRETKAGSSWTSLQATYELSAHQEAKLQADWFSGNANETFGALAARSRLAASIRMPF